MILSILIPSIPERRHKLLPLLNELYRQCLALQTTHPSLGSVEILVDDSVKFLDGGLSIGQKRELLKQRACGTYLCFLDDDDNVTPNYIEQLVRLCNEGQDIVTFRTLIKNDHYWALIDMQLTNLVNGEVNPHGTIDRTPWHICPVKSSIAKNESFTSINHNEDWDWMQRVLLNVHTESHSDMILTQYNHSEAGSEADRIVKEPALRSSFRSLIITLSVNGRENYQAKSVNLENSITKYWGGDYRVYKGFPEWCTPHEVIPYKFKFDLIRQAKKDGYNRVVWLDSSIRLNRFGNDLMYLFENNDHGIFAFDNLGHPLQNYISDIAVKNLGITAAELDKIPQTWGGAIGFDFTNQKAFDIFNEIYAQSTTGSFETSGSTRPGFISHRHDQAVMSVIFWKHGYKLLPYGTIAAKADVTEKTYLQYGD